MPCPTSVFRTRHRAASGIARLEFALTLIVCGVIAAMAFGHVTQVRSAADIAKAETAAAQVRSMSALAQARGLPPQAPASATHATQAQACSVSFTREPRNEAASGPVSCL